MAGDLAMTVQYDEGRVEAKKILKMARAMLALLDELEKGMNKTKRARLTWDVNIYSLLDRAVIEFTCVGKRELGRKIAEEAARRGQPS